MRHAAYEVMHGKNQPADSSRGSWPARVRQLAGTPKKCRYSEPAPAGEESLFLLAEITARLRAAVLIKARNGGLMDFSRNL